MQFSDELGDPIGPPCGWKDYGLNVDFIPKFWDSLSLTDNDWKLIMTGAEQVTRPNNTLLIEQGKKNVKLIRVKKGSIRVERERGVTAVVLPAGMFFADIHLCLLSTFSMKLLQPLSREVHSVVGLFIYF